MRLKLLIRTISEACSCRGRTCIISQVSYLRLIFAQQLLLGPGTDLIVANRIPPFKDLVVYGRDFNRVTADPRDVVAPDCERIGIIRRTVERLQRESYSMRHKY